jgi:hypothetical protein
MWKVVKDVDDEYSDGEWEDVEVVVKEAGGGGGGGTVGRGSDEGQTKSIKSTNSREEWASEKKGRDSSKVTSREAQMRRATGS